MQPLNPSSSNIYALSDALSPAQTREMLILAVALFILGALLIEGGILARAYDALAQLIGVRARPELEAPSPLP